VIYSISVRNVNEAYAQGLRWLAARGEAQTSRVGTVVVSPMPVVTCYSQPTQRVLFSPMRDANPFFHLMESVWMLAGSNDIAFPVQFNKRFAEYSDDGKTQWGAYGWRWRKFFGYDQLPLIIEELKRDPRSRRCVLSMWSAGDDLNVVMNGGKDVPCNTNVFFRVVDGKLDMMVNNRSNDVIWGAYGANAVHMSILHEFIASAAGYGVGRYYQTSWNFHAYTDIYPLENFPKMAENALDHDYYVKPDIDLPRPYVMPLPLFSVDTKYEDFLRECEEFVASNGEGEYMELFLRDVAQPMMKVWRHHKAKEYAEADAECAFIRAMDWRQASRAWIQRRAAKWAAKGVQHA
jgi:hypothetical protein